MDYCKCSPWPHERLSSCMRQVGEVLVRPADFWYIFAAQRWRCNVILPRFNVLDNCEPIAGIDSIASEYLCNQTALGTYAEAIVRVELVKNRADLIAPNGVDV